MGNGSQLHVRFALGTICTHSALGTICTQRRQLDMYTTGEKLPKLQENTIMQHIRILCTQRSMVPIIKLGTN